MTTPVVAANVATMSMELVTRSHGFSHMVSHLIEGRSFALASFVLVLYDYLVTLDSEIRHFWSGAWTISRVLFLFNRYLTMAVLGFRLMADFMPKYFPAEFCNIALRINFPLNLIALTVVQGILIIRLWYLFTSSRILQRILLAAYISCTIGQFVILGLFFPMLNTSRFQIPDTDHYFCMDPGSGTMFSISGNGSVGPHRAGETKTPFWAVFVPGFALWVILKIFLVIRIWRNVRRGRRDAEAKGSVVVSLRKRMTKDGGFLYLLVFFSGAFSICAAIFGASPSIGVVAMFANFMLALLSITVSRVIFHIVHLMKVYSSDPCSKDPLLLLHTRNFSLDSSNGSTFSSSTRSAQALTNRLSQGWTRNMGVLLFVPPEDYHIDDDDLYDGDDGWRELREEKNSRLDDVYY